MESWNSSAEETTAYYDPKNLLETRNCVNILKVNIIIIICWGTFDLLVS